MDSDLKKCEICDFQINNENNHNFIPERRSVLGWRERAAQKKELSSLNKPFGKYYCNHCAEKLKVLSFERWVSDRFKDKSYGCLESELEEKREELENEIISTNEMLKNLEKMNKEKFAKKDKEISDLKEMVFKLTDKLQILEANSNLETKLSLIIESISNISFTK